MLGGLGLALTVGASGAAAEKLTFASSLTLSSSDPRFGGLSAIEVSADGRQAIAVSDRGDVFHLGLTRDKGALIAVTSERLPEQKLQGDSEGLAIGPDGQWHVSFEGPARVERVPSAALPENPDFAKLPGNRALEALAVDRNGDIYTIPETTTNGRQIPIYRWDGANWEIVQELTRKGRFMPAGADFGPDGRLYVLERSLDLMGFRARILRLVPGQTEPAEVLLTTRGLTHDNLEGISVWRDDQLRLRITMVSDDNFRAIQRTEIVEYIVNE